MRFSSLTIKNINGVALALAGCLLFSCTKLVEVDTPPTMVDNRTAFESDATAAAVLTGIYSNMGTTSFMAGGITSTSVFLGLSADELSLSSAYTGPAVPYYMNNYSSNNLSGSDFWRFLYSTIYAANAAIEGLNSTEMLTPEVKNQLLGEAKFIRAFSYFYLTNLYGHVPLVLSTSYSKTALMARADSSVIYSQIIQDLGEAKEQLSTNYVNGTIVGTSTERTRPNTFAASALLARVYLYLGDWASAESEASEVIDNTSMYALSPLSNVFLIGGDSNMEAIWQLQPVIGGYNSRDAMTFVVPETGLNFFNPISLSADLKASFEDRDQRKTEWVGSVVVNDDTTFFPFKYKQNIYNAPVSEYEMMLRLAEQFLIRAEARAHQENITGGKSDIDAIRLRAGLVPAIANDRMSLLTAIMLERRIELFSEWGHRWFDLKRTDMLDQVLTPIVAQKNGEWASHKRLFPLPVEELRTNPNLTQTLGY